jgi:RP/EB family microtubule-associated protein
MSRSSAPVASKGELLDWLNALLGIHYAKVEETSDGAAFCQVFDAIYPGKVKLHKVNYSAATETEMISNYKILQEVLNSQKITRNVPIETLTKGRCMAALEMLQWVKSHFDQTFTGGDYDGPGRRQEVGIRDPGESVKPAKKPVGRLTSAREPKPMKTPLRQVQIQAPPATNAKAKPIANQPPIFTPGRQSQIQTVKEQLEKTKEDNKSLTEERTFYYNKLQKVEATCQTKGGDDFASQVLAILYETDDAHGFVSPDELDI